MIHFKIYNDDKIRHWNGFPKLNDPNVLELSLLRIINEYLEAANYPYRFKEFNIHDPALNSILFTYYSSSNFNAWGQLPFGYIYNDMIRHIQNQNTSNNFIMTLESIYIDKFDTIMSSLLTNRSPEDFAYGLITSYITENYLNSYKYILNYNNGVLVIIIPKEDGLLAYIIAVGFDPFSMSKWFCTNNNFNDPDAIPFARYCSIAGLAKSKVLKDNRNSKYFTDDEFKVFCECAESKVQKNIKGCQKLVSSYDISNLRKKSIYDTEVKYGDYPIDYNWLNLYDVVVPAVYLMHTFKSGEKVLLNRFNQPDDYRADYRLLKKQDDIIKIEKKIKQMKE